jgi:hypothetical protein
MSHPAAYNRLGTDKIFLYTMFACQVFVFKTLLQKEFVGERKKLFLRMGSTSAPAFCS